jgi:hypothetical protein
LLRGMHASVERVNPPREAEGRQERTKWRRPGEGASSCPSIQGARGVA